MAFRRAKRDPDAAYAAASADVKAFWGVGHNRPDAYSALERALSSHGLTAGQVDRLRMELPPIQRETTTGAKVLRVDSLLQRIHAAAGGG
jgi:hypothetical protein